MEITAYKPIKKGTLEAIVSVSVPKWGDFIIREMCYFVKGSQQWVSFPSKMYEHNGEKKYWSYMAFKDQSTDKVFKDKVVAAIQGHVALNGDEQFPKSANAPSQQQENSDVPF